MILNLQILIFFSPTPQMAYLLSLSLSLLSPFFLWEIITKNEYVLRDLHLAHVYIINKEGDTSYW